MLRCLFNFDRIKKGSKYDINVYVYITINYAQQLLPSFQLFQFIAHAQTDA